ncbi:hypothetical protein F8A10_03610 [Paracoccus kondratievae]|uniref:Uncharacterized protein n=1 Tax=Paracoccus kondratievae TaxID=135740 RepID=A0AAD3P0Y7_9RHOB|nr:MULTISPECIES: DUF6478 family protein [Paracoccus]QFQ86605.1 hypothetical protein F8A10_03610 [Paracoccus kondratievae]GLK65484.1 hypothetical protein GCM10017635_29590 [Paracoccus kondratievae]
MAIRPDKWLERRVRERALQQWTRLGNGVGTLSSASLRHLRDDAIALRSRLDRFLIRADERAARSRAALDALHLPGGTDWRWRPEFMAAPVSPHGVAEPENGAQLGEGVAVWHDCPEKALIIEQIANTGASDLSPFGVRLEVFGFAGSFLSMSVDLPTAALLGLTRGHVVRLETSIRVERPLNIYARLNIGHGPNTDDMTLHVGGLQPGQFGQQVIEFDLAYTPMNEKRLEKIWLDLIFESPRMNAVDIRELFLSRHLRAEF